MYYGISGSIPLTKRDEMFRATILERNIENSSDSAEFANFLNPQITNQASKLRASKAAVNKIIWTKAAANAFRFSSCYIINFKNYTFAIIDKINDA